jgi:hypothetical protein
MGKVNISEIKMTGNTTHLSILILNGFNAPIQRQRTVSCIRKQDPIIYVGYKEIHLPERLKN